MVFRRKDNDKWFAIIMDVPADKLGLDGSQSIDIVNLKADPGLVDELTRHGEGFLPAYHMNKSHWLSVRLDGNVDDTELSRLIRDSYERNA